MNNHRFMSWLFLLAGTAVSLPVMAITSTSVIQAGGAPRLGDVTLLKSEMLDWQPFTVNSGEQVKFLQPGASAVLARISPNDLHSGGDFRIAATGSLMTNGRTWISNPGAIVIRSNDQVLAINLSAVFPQTYPILVLTVPEPHMSSLMLAGLGAMGVVVFRRRKAPDGTSVNTP